MAERPREITNEEFLDGFQRQVSRLDIQISNVDSGHDEVRDDLASSLRTLVCRGKGDDAIRRFCSRFGYEQPKRPVGRDIYDSELEHLQLGFCGLPIDRDHDDATQVAVPDELDAMTCALFRDGNELKRFTWHDVILDYGNTYGSHLSTTVPALFDRVQVFGVGHTDFGTFMLRNLAVTVSSACHKLLSTHIKGHTSTVHSQYFHGIQIPIGMYIRQDGTDELLAYIQKQNWKKAGRLLAITNIDGKLLTWSIDNQGKMSLSVTEGN